jgi:hypothetical protein
LVHACQGEQGQKVSPAWGAAFGPASRQKPAKARGGARRPSHAAPGGHITHNATFEPLLMLAS